MRCLWLENKKLKYRDDFEIPVVPENEALVRVKLAGICQTDLELVNGYYPFTGIIGHEFVGEIVEAPSDPERIGERVIGEINASCGQCRFCMQGLPTHCPTRNVLGIVQRNGAFADFLTLPVSNLISIPSKVPDEAAVFTEPLAAAFQIQEQVNFRPDDHILLVGAGKLGLLIAMLLKQSGSHLTVLVRHEFQESLLRKMDISTIKETHSLDKMFDIVIDASGSRQGFAAALRCTRPQGTLILKSTYSGNTSVDLARLVVDEIKLIGSRCGPFEPALRLLQQGKINPIPLIIDRFPIEKGIEAMVTAAAPSKLKVVLDF